MKDQVLTIEQMNILADRDIDINKASMCYLLNKNRLEFNLVTTEYMEMYKLWENHDWHATFTATDLMEMLPHKIKINDRVCELVVNKGSVSKGWYVCYSESASVLDAEMINCDMSLITALFEMSTWVLDNGYKLNNQI